MRPLEYHPSGPSPVPYDGSMMSVGLAPDGAPMMPIEVQPAGWMMQPEPAMQWWGQPGMVPVPIHRNVSAPVSMSGNEVPGYPMGYMGGMAPGFSPLYTAELHQQHQFQQQQLAAAAAAGQVVYMHPGGPTMHPGVMSPGPMMAGLVIIRSSLNLPRLCSSTFISIQLLLSSNSNSSSNSTLTLARRWSSSRCCSRWLRLLRQGRLLKATSRSKLGLPDPCK